MDRVNVDQCMTGVRRQTLHYIRAGRHAMSYGMQVLLEGVIEEGREAK